MCARLLDMCLTSGPKAGTALEIFNTMDNALRARDIPWNQCVSLSMDNTSVNMGTHNSIKSRVVQMEESMCLPCYSQYFTES